MIRFFYVIWKSFYMVFTRHSAGKIWSSICIQDILLHYHINLSDTINLTRSLY